MIYNQDICQSGELVLPDEQEMLNFPILEFSENLGNVGHSDSASVRYDGETIGAFMTVSDTTFEGGQQVGRCAFIRIKDADYPERIILPFLTDNDTVCLVEVVVFCNSVSKILDCSFTVVASVGSIAEDVVNNNYIVYEPVLYAK